MSARSPLMPGAWVSTLALLFGLVVLANSGTAEETHSLVDHDAVKVTVAEDVSISPLSKIAQVGFLDFLQDGSHKSSCHKCGKPSSRCCCGPWWAHRTGVFGEFMAIRPGNADQIYTVEQASVTPGDDPTGPVGRVNIDLEAAYRVGFSWSASQCTSLVGSYSRFEGAAASSITATGANVLSSLVIHPSTPTVGAAGLGASARQSIDFRLFDLGYRHLWKGCDNHVINWLAGIRFGELDQDLLVTQNIGVATGLVSVDTDIDFDGFGVSLGLDGERRSSDSGAMVYGRTLASFLAGDWEASYVQVPQLAGGIVANRYQDYRITPVLELELGLGWRNQCGNLRASVGYTASAWYNAISTRQYINAVRSTNYVSVDETVTFSGLTTRFEFTF